MEASGGLVPRPHAAHWRAVAIGLRRVPPPCTNRPRTRGSSIRERGDDRVVRRSCSRHALQEPREARDPRGDQAVRIPNSIPSPTISTRKPLSARCSRPCRLGLAHWAMAMRLAVETRLFGKLPLAGPRRRRAEMARPGAPGRRDPSVGEVVELTPSRSKPQGIARRKWTAFNDAASRSRPSIRSRSFRAASPDRAPVLRFRLQLAPR